MTPSKPTDLQLISDEPVATLAEDRLSLETFANTIASVALGTEGPFTIGVFGGWGHGKTSLLRLAQHMLDGEKRDDTWSHTHIMTRADAGIVKLRSIGCPDEA